MISIQNYGGFKKNFILRKNQDIPVESSFVGDQCSWILWVTLKHKFTSPGGTFYKVMNCPVY